MFYIYIKFYICLDLFVHQISKIEKILRKEQLRSFHLNIKNHKRRHAKWYLVYKYGVYVRSLRYHSNEGIGVHVSRVRCRIVPRHMSTNDGSLRTKEYPLVIN